MLTGKTSVDEEPTLLTETAADKVLSTSIQQLAWSSNGLYRVEDTLQVVQAESIPESRRHFRVTHLTGSSREPTDEQTVVYILNPLFPDRNAPFAAFRYSYNGSRGRGGYIAPDFNKAVSDLLLLPYVDLWDDTKLSDLALRTFVRLSDEAAVEACNTEDEFKTANYVPVGGIHTPLSDCIARLYGDFGTPSGVGILTSIGRLQHKDSLYTPQFQEEVQYERDNTKFFLAKYGVQDVPADSNAWFKFWGNAALYKLDFELDRLNGTLFDISNNTASPAVSKLAHSLATQLLTQPDSTTFDVDLTVPSVLGPLHVKFTDARSTTFVTLRRTMQATFNNMRYNTNTLVGGVTMSAVALAACGFLYNRRGEVGQRKRLTLEVDNIEDFQTPYPGSTLPLYAEDETLGAASKLCASLFANISSPAQKIAAWKTHLDGDFLAKLKQLCFAKEYDALPLPETMHQNALAPTPTVATPHFLQVHSFANAAIVQQLVLYCDVGMLWQTNISVEKKVFKLPENVAWLAPTASCYIGVPLDQNTQPVLTPLFAQEYVKSTTLSAQEHVENDVLNAITKRFASHYCAWIKDVDASIADYTKPVEEDAQTATSFSVSDLYSGVEDVEPTNGSGDETDSDIENTESTSDSDDEKDLNSEGNAQDTFADEPDDDYYGKFDDLSSVWLTLNPRPFSRFSDLYISQELDTELAERQL